MALMSMTGYGRAAGDVGGSLVEVEIKSVNSRHLDVVMRLPPALAHCEAECGKLVREHVTRGRVEVAVQRTEHSLPSYELRFNNALFSGLWDKAREAARSIGVDPASISGDLALHALSYREVLEVTPVRDPAVDESAAFLSLLTTALKELTQMRSAEGKELTQDLSQHLASLIKLEKQLTKLAQQSPDDYRQRLTQRLEKLGPEVSVDPQRLAQEVALMADRTNIDEELTRLRSHFGQMAKFLSEAGAAKKVEFLLQELQREFNTCGSKCQNSELQHLVVEAKATLEKMREQAANLE